MIKKALGVTIPALFALGMIAGTGTAASAATHGKKHHHVHVTVKHHDHKKK
jgi:hypothetical protein